MKFINKNIIALILVTLLLSNELLHLLFKDIPFNIKVNMNAPIYYFTLSIRNLLTSIIIFVLVDKKKISERCIIFGCIIWNTIELYQEICYLAKINEVTLYINDGLWGQVTFILVVIFLSIYGFTKYKS